MREIKFRAWSKGVNRMSYFGDGTCLISNTELKEGDVWGMFFKVQGDGCVYLTGYQAVMQYTGLKDKNGKEIYEGDIVVKDGYIWFDDGIPNYRGTVEWVYSQWQVIAHCVNPKKQGISNGMNEGLNDDGFEDGKNSDWEVIGNIYENQELLKEDNNG